MAICRLDGAAAIPEWATARAFFSITRGDDELSIICPSSQIPAGVAAHDGWIALKLRGPFELTMVGVLHAVAEPLARAGVSIMAVATHDTDYVLVRREQLDVAVDALVGAGHRVRLTTLTDQY